MRKIISLICFLLPAVTFAADAQIRDNAPEQHIVTQGDTLWGIAHRFFNDPWQWPQIWGLNQDTIKDPHWIYPGDVVRLDRQHGKLDVDTARGTGGIVKLTPQVRSSPGRSLAIPAVPRGDIAPFLKYPLVVNEGDLAHAPLLVATLDERVVVGDDDIVYVQGLDRAQGIHWQLYRPGKALIDPDSGQVLGHEAIFLGEVQVEQFGNPSTVRIVHATQEIKKGDRLIARAAAQSDNFIPRAPGSRLSSKVISVHGGAELAGQHSVITLNKGQRDGLEVGHVLTLTRHGGTLRNDDQALCEAGDAACKKGQSVTLPDQHYGLIFVFRTFERVAYALVMETRMPVELLDNALTP